ncbi:hypothetical protein B0H11DRAFT_1928348 [Mycena galericulata]|nr:hypothetical protein B0H11DRAFT_1928348 [Mycena galericulata]
MYGKADGNQAAIKLPPMPAQCKKCDKSRGAGAAASALVRRMSLELYDAPALAREQREYTSRQRDTVVRNDTLDLSGRDWRERRTNGGARWLWGARVMWEEERSRGLRWLTFPLILLISRKTGKTFWPPAVIGFNREAHHVKVTDSFKLFPRRCAAAPTTQLVVGLGQPAGTSQLEIVAYLHRAFSSRLFGGRQASGGRSGKSRVSVSRTLLDSAAMQRRRAAPPATLTKSLFLAAGRRTPPSSGSTRQTQLTHVVEAFHSSLRRHEAAPVAPRRRIAFPRAGETLLFGRRQARPTFSESNRQTQFPNFVEVVTALRRREAAPIAPRRRIAFPRAAYIRTGNAPRRRIDVPRTASQATGGHISLPNQSTRFKPGIQNAIFG